MRAIPAGLTLAGVRAEKNRRRWLGDPVAWNRERCGGFLWSKQRQIIESVRDNRRTAVPSCHGAGKSYTAAQIAAWWIDVHPPGEAFVVTTAPTQRQVRNILWRELNRAKARGNLRGRMNQVEWHLTVLQANGKAAEEIVAFGAKPADMDTAAFQGIHARYVLVIFDEADGIPANLYEAAEGLLSNDDARHLLIGNPVNPTSEFASCCLPGSGYNVIPISAFDTPNFTGEPIPERLTHDLVGRVWVEEKKKKWGETNPLYLARVLGQFPPHSSDGLIPIAWIRAAQDRELEPVGANELGVDVGGGIDKNITASRRGPVVRIIRDDTEPNTMTTCGHVLSDLKTTGASIARVDEIGIGRGIVDRAKEIAASDSKESVATRALARRVRGVNVGAAARDPESFMNLKAEGYRMLRDIFQEGNIDIDPDDDDLAAQLVRLKTKVTSTGKEQAVSKDEYRREYGDSPDRAEAVMLAFLKTTFTPAGALDVGGGTPDPTGGQHLNRRL